MVVVMMLDDDDDNNDFDDGGGNDVSNDALTTTIMMILLYILLYPYLSIYIRSANIISYILYCNLTLKYQQQQEEELSSFILLSSIIIYIHTNLSYQLIILYISTCDVNHLRLWLLLTN